MASNIKYNNIISTLRSIQRELKQSLKNSESKSNDATIQHMLSLFRANQVTEKRFCRPEDHYKYFAETYLTYLKSARLQAEIEKKYFHKGDRSIEDSARSVGLELPKRNH